MATSKNVALLDVDGTLIDSNDAHAASWVDTFAEFGHDVAFERVRELIGKGGDKLVPETIGLRKESPEGAEIAKRRSVVFEKTYLPRIRPFPGARDLLLAMRERGLRLVVATSAQGDELAKLLDIAGVRDLIEKAATSSDAKDSKPDPDIVIAALRRAGCAPREAVMLGDTPYDVEACRKAGVTCVALRCGGWKDEHLANAAAIYDDVRDLRARLDDSPFIVP